MRGLRLMLRRSVRIDHDRLLDGAQPGSRQSPPGPPNPLAGLLRAAAAPPRERELAGEEAALAAFRAARQGSPVASPGARSPRRRITAGAVAWIAALAATATAGAALAASGLDRPEQPPAPRPAATSPSAPSTDPSAPTSTPGDDGRTGDPAGEPTDRPSTDPSGGSTSGTPAPATPSPSGSPLPDTEASGYVGPGNSASTTDRTGLCRAYLAKSERQRERALRTSAFAELVAEAGGTEHVEAYCRDLLAGS
ncbi:hypothetical protein SAMN05443287_104381 [Micromonospora phaseoli]|uniref:Uncharacterized protein n=1 Tax=Micromonospora phaseoli TaxID=1144548 RepID=A0A1H6YRC1_9ACTN|nr:hypothetical protein [Micromonospora phaseoli]PZW00352.1 hypothetical protein CLV64_103380 [Micromonospora phaseoli]GIJ76830.1 hypothetical protein Xph01_12620 [Micromonospora phaseoli]SEJ43799.1 hypothetical protein SAMN05443287_104381 [Micromonospora phaseoli]